MVEVPLLATIERRQQSDGTFRPEITALHQMNWLTRVWRNLLARMRAPTRSAPGDVSLHEPEIAIGTDSEALGAIFGSGSANGYRARSAAVAQQRVRLILTPSRHLVHEAAASKEQDNGLRA